MVSFRARRAVGLFLAGRVCAQSTTTWPCYDSASGATCSNCYSLSDGRCQTEVTDSSMCVGAWYKWCGTNPCDSCSGCYKYGDDVCDTTISDQHNCFYWNGVWCGAPEPTCTGCNSCYLPSLGKVGAFCDSSKTSEIECTKNNFMDNLTMEWTFPPPGAPL